MITSKEPLVAPVEISFGDVVEFLSPRNGEPSPPCVVTDPVSEHKIHAARIVGYGDTLLLERAGTREEPARVIGNWPLEDVIEGWVRNNPSPDGSVSAETRRIVTKVLTKNSQKPAVMYIGTPQGKRELPP